MRLDLHNQNGSYLTLTSIVRTLGMWEYDWEAWNARASSPKNEWALERWFLMYLHEQQNVDRLALAVADRLMADDKNIQVRVQSIWVDGTPQAAFSPKDHLSHEERPQCELADLLLCVRLESPNGQLQREQAMLIQAKVASDYDELPGGESTQKERQLFEECDRNQVITVYPGVKRKKPIGDYQLGNGSDQQAYGLHDCARYLLMANQRWGKMDKKFAPLQVGWPLLDGHKQISPPEPLLDAVMGMLPGTKTELGREIKTGTAAVNCVWTKMVSDLRGKYSPVTMKGYNKQPRVTTSADTVRSPYLVYSVLSESRNNSVMSAQWQTWLSLNFPSSRHRPTDRLKYYLGQWFFRKKRWSSEGTLEYLRTSGIEGADGINIWSENSNPPPTADSNMSDGNDPHISMLIITIRGLEPERRPG